jgi:hypothetical protein
MKKAFLVLLILALGTGTACKDQGADSIRVEVRDGIEYIHNTEVPLHPEWTVAFEEELSIESVDPDGNVLIYQAGAYDVDQGGTIYICDRMDHGVKVFDDQGRIIRTIGRKGEGPGEFSNISRVACLPDGRLLVMDWELKRVSLFSSEGTFIQSHKYQDSSFDVYLAGGTLYAREVMTIEPGGAPMEWRRILFVKAYDYSGAELFSYGQFTPAQSNFVNEAGEQFSYSPPFPVESVLAGDTDTQCLYHFLSDAYRIEVFDPQGKVFRKIDRPYRRLPVTQEDKKRYLAGFRSTSANKLTLIEKNAAMPDLKPVCERMLVDDAGRIWVELSEIRQEEGRTLTAYDIFDRDGRYLHKIWIEKRPGLFRNGRMYRMEADDETGDRTLKRYSILWSDAVARPQEPA